MKNIIAAIIVSFFASQAFAETPTFVACYGETARLGLIFDGENKTFTYQRADDNGQVDFDAVPTTDLFKKNSYVQINGSQTSYVFKAHIIAGNVETPLFTHAEMTFQKHPDEGTYRLVSASLVHHDVVYDLNEFIGISCYIQ